MGTKITLISMKKLEASKNFNLLFNKRNPPQYKVKAESVSLRVFI